MTLRASVLSVSAVAALLVVLAPLAAQAQSGAVLDSLRARLRQHPADAGAHLAMARRLVEVDRQPEAIQAYERALRVPTLPDDARREVVRRLAQLYSWNERPDDALRMYRQAVRLVPEDVDARRKLAQRYFWADRPREGIRQLEALLQYQPDDLEARRQLAQHYLWADRAEDAVAAYEELLRRAPDDVEAIGQLAQQYLWSSRLEEAAALYRRLLQQRPDSVAARLSLGKALAWNGRSDEALSVLEEVLRQHSDQPEALLLAGEAQRWNGDWQEGRRRLRRVLELDSNAARARELLRGLRAQYGPQAELQYRRLSDSNDLTVERVPLAFSAYVAGAWRAEGRLSRTRFTDDRAQGIAPAVEADVRGYHATLALQHTFATGTQARVEVGGATYSTGWTPLSAGVEVVQPIVERVSLTGRYDWTEATEGTAVLDRKIRRHTVATEGYAQATSRLDFSALLGYTRYSDDNTRLTTYAGASYQLRQGNPGLVLTADYSFDDTGTIYDTSIPYWTPDALSTVSARLKIDQALFGDLKLGGSGGAARQEDEWARIFSVHIGIEDVRFHTLRIAYEQSGSSAYSSTGFTARYAYRF